MQDDLDSALGGVGERLRALRRERGLTLAELSTVTDISASTLSRLESGQRRANLELLLPVARALEVTLDDLVAVPPPADPRVRRRPVTRDGTTIVPLTRRLGGIQAFKLVLRPERIPHEPDLRTHDGYEWLYVLAGRLRLVLGAHDLVLDPGEAAEFDTRVPHWFGVAGTDPVEVLSLFGPQGERMHVRARPRPAATAPGG